MAVVNFSAKIRSRREDLTDFVVHLTRPRQSPAAPGFQVLLEILQAGYIRPTFAPMTSPSSGGKPRATVKGPSPAVCLTEQPISAILATLEACPTRYSGYGVAYWKPTLFDYGALPVLYAGKGELGRRIKQGEAGWEEGKDIFRGGLPADLQYLWVNYDPLGVGPFNHAIDFTWEREWRIKFPNSRIKEAGLPVALRNPWSEHQGAIIVARDCEVEEVKSRLRTYREQQSEWGKYIERVISLETANRQLAAGDRRYARLETWPSPGGGA
jgi:hypothetical protein